MNSKTRKFLNSSQEKIQVPGPFTDKRSSAPFLIQSPSGKRFIKLKAKDASISPNIEEERKIVQKKRHSQMPALTLTNKLGPHPTQPSPVQKLGKGVVETFIQSPGMGGGSRQPENVFEVGFKKGTAASQLFFMIYHKENQVLLKRFNVWKFGALSTMRNYKILTTVTEVTVDEEQQPSPVKHLSFEGIADDQENLIFKALSALFRYWGRRVTRSFFDWKHKVISGKQFQEYKARLSQKRKNAKLQKSGRFSENLIESEQDEHDKNSKVENLRFLHKHEHLRIISPIGFLFDLMSRLYYPKLKIAFRRIEHGTQFSSRLIKKARACTVISGRFGQQIQWTFNKWRHESNQLKLKIEIGGAARLIQRREKEMHSLTRVINTVTRVYLRALSRGFIKWKVQIENNEVLATLAQEIQERILNEQRAQGNVGEEPDLIQYEAGTGGGETGMEDMQEQRLSVLSNLDSQQASFIEEEEKFKTPDSRAGGDGMENSVEKIRSLIKAKKSDDVLMHRIKAVCYEMLLDILHH